MGGVRELAGLSQEKREPAGGSWRAMETTERGIVVTAGYRRKEDNRLIFPFIAAAKK